MTACSLVVALRSDAGGAAGSAAPCALSALATLSAERAFAELLIVGRNDGSQCESAAAAAAPAGADVRWIAPPPGAGWAAACNAGARAAAHPRLAFLAEDVSPHQGWLPSLLRVFDRQPRAAAAGSRVLASADTIHHAGIAVDGQGWPRRLYAGLPAAHPAVNVTRPMQMVSGGSLLVRRDAFAAIGWFDEALIADDAMLDACLRLRAAGDEVYYCHDSVATCPPRGPDFGESLAAVVRSNRLFRTRWIGALRPDDVLYYQADGLLRVTYQHVAATVTVSSPLLTASPALAAE